MLLPPPLHLPLNLLNAHKQSYASILMDGKSPKAIFRLGFIQFYICSVGFFAAIGSNIDGDRELDELAIVVELVQMAL